MPDSPSPIEDAIKSIATNELRLDGSASQHGGKEASVTLEREKGPVSGGVSAGISDEKGWSVSGFFKWIWGKP